MIYWKNDFLLSIFLLLVSIATYVSALAYPEVPGQFPKFLAIAFGGLSLLLMFNAISRRKDSGKFFEDIGKFYGPTMISIGVAIYAFSLKHLGYITSSILLVLYVIFILGYRDKKRALITSIITVVLVFVAFRIFLMVPLPLDFFIPE